MTEKTPPYYKLENLIFTEVLFHFSSNLQKRVSQLKLRKNTEKYNTKIIHSLYGI